MRYITLKMARLSSYKIIVNDIVLLPVLSKTIYGSYGKTESEISKSLTIVHIINHMIMGFFGISVSEKSFSLF